MSVSFELRSVVDSYFRLLCFFAVVVRFCCLVCILFCIVFNLVYISYFLICYFCSFLFFCLYCVFFFCAAVYLHLLLRMNAVLHTFHVAQEHPSRIHSTVEEDSFRVEVVNRLQG